MPVFKLSACASHTVSDVCVLYVVDNLKGLGLKNLGWVDVLGDTGGHVTGTRLVFGKDLMYTIFQQACFGMTRLVYLGSHIARQKPMHCNSRCDNLVPISSRTQTTRTRIWFNCSDAFTIGLRFIIWWLVHVNYVTDKSLPITIRLLASHLALGGLTAQWRVCWWDSTPFRRGFYYVAGSIQWRTPFSTSHSSLLGSNAQYPKPSSVRWKAQTPQSLRPGVQESHIVIRSRSEKIFIHYMLT